MNALIIMVITELSNEFVYPRDFSHAILIMIPLGFVFVKIPLGNFKKCKFVLSLSHQCLLSLQKGFGGYYFYVFLELELHLLHSFPVLMFRFRQVPQLLIYLQTLFLKSSG